MRSNCVVFDGYAGLRRHLQSNQFSTKDVAILDGKVGPIVYVLLGKLGRQSITRY
jgi:hypothetical protein